jgi:hypothetical protein
MIFDIKDNKPIITPEGLNIPEFKEIWKSDKDRYKRLAQGTLAYIYHMLDPRSVYANLSEKDKEREIIKDYIPESNRRGGYTPPERVLKAMEKYEKLIDTPLTRLLASARRGIDKTSEYFDGIDYTEIDELTGAPKYDINKVMGAYAKLDQVIKSVSELEKQVKKDLAINQDKIVGNKSTGYLENILNK